MKCPALVLLILSLGLVSVPVYSAEFDPVLAGLFSSDTELKKDVPYVPTPNRVVEEMLAMAKVTDKDTLYDLGCGDGRIVITAATRYGARGVGIDIDPQRIKESEENATAAGVNGKVRFIRQDLFQADMKDATVVTLYLLSSVNLKLRPRLLNQLRPGTRIVSHSFDMGEWKPDQTSTASNPVYFWIVPANVSGTWSWSTPSGEYTFDLQQKFQEATGTLSAGGGSSPLKNVIISGDKVRFDVDLMKGGKVTPATFSGKVKGDSIEGTMEDRGNSGKKMEWKARRDPATKQPIDGEETSTVKAPAQKVI